MLRRLLLFFLLLLGGTAVSHSAAQAEYQLRLSAPDLSAFPTVRVTVQTADANSVPAADFAALRVQEDGRRVNFAQRIVPVGIDVIFVLDANDAMLAANGAGETAYAQVQASTRRFAERFMSPSGRDRVSIVVPQADGAGGERLLSGADDPAAVTAALEAYAPAAGTAVPLNRMMAIALTEARRLQTGNRFQAILLFSDAARLDVQIEDAIITQAQAQQVALFTAVLGPQMTFAELDNATRLAAPTRGDVVHMPQPAAADAFYLVWQRQANHVQISYESNLRESGVYPLTVTLGPAGATTAIDLALRPPQPALLLQENVIARRGDAPDAPLAALTPQSVQIPVQVQFPDGIGRELTTLALLVNGRPVQTVTAPPPLLDADGRATLTWDVRASDTGAYELAVEASDRFGLTAVSAPLLLTLVTERPSAVAPTALPPTPTTELLPPLTDLPQLPAALRLLQNETALIAGSLVVGLLAALLLWRRLRGESLPAAPLPTAPPSATSPSATPPPATLVWLEGGPAAPTTLAGAPALIGRDAAQTQVTLDFPSVSAVHARIRWRDGRYWLYDEGSAAGTFLNHERLGLTPRPLQDGDHIRFGRVACTFQTSDPPPE